MPNKQPTSVIKAGQLLDGAPCDVWELIRAITAAAPIHFSSTFLRQRPRRVRPETTQNSLVCRRLGSRRPAGAFPSARISLLLGGASKLPSRPGGPAAGDVTAPVSTARFGWGRAERAGRARAGPGETVVAKPGPPLRICSPCCRPPANRYLLPDLWLLPLCIWGVCMYQGS